MSNEEAGYAASRRTPRQGMGASPVGSWLSVVLALVAVVAGFLILKNITDDGGTAGGNGGIVGGPTDDEPENSVLSDPSIPEATTTTTSTTMPRVIEGASVVVANANTVSGSAGAMTKSLELQGYDTEEAVNASGPNISASVVYYEPSIDNAQAVAESVARDLGGVDVEQVTSPAPTGSGDLGGAGVLVVLGDDQAGKSIEELRGDDEVDATASATVPEPSDGDVPASAPAAADDEADE